MVERGVLVIWVEAAQPQLTTATQKIASERDDIDGSNRYGVMVKVYRIEGLSQDGKGMTGRNCFKA
jgi:hypothetical protein